MRATFSERGRITCLVAMYAIRRAGDRNIRLCRQQNGKRGGVGLFLRAAPAQNLISARGVLGRPQLQDGGGRMLCAFSHLRLVAQPPGVRPHLGDEAFDHQPS